MVLGQISLTNIYWHAPGEIGVRFTSPHADKFHQLYLGRRLVAETGERDDRVLTAAYSPTRWPEVLCVAAIGEDELGIDNGAGLPPRAYNRARLAFSNSGWSGDPHETNVAVFELCRGTAVAGAVSYATVIDRALAEVPGSFELESDPLPGSGTWNLGVRGRDELGNIGTEVETSLLVWSTPPDIETVPVVAGGSGSFDFTLTIPED